ncbi:MAG: glycosyltransferase family 4 protein [Chloroflexi bacterium]|nr:glycosyltransferase family 4 protein [Chloroflexota bacterium]
MSNHRIVVDVSAAINGRAGLGRYAASLAAALAEQHPGQVALFGNRSEDARPVPAFKDVPLRTVAMSYKPWRLAVYLGQLSSMNFARVVGPSDLYHATEHLLVPVRGIPSVLTVHDLIFKRFPAYHKRLNYWYLNQAMPLFVRRAQHIIAVSEATKADLIQYYNTPEDKISVVYEAAHSRFSPQDQAEVARVRAIYQLPERYLLAVGTIEPRKNYARVIEVLARLRVDDPELKLVIVGVEGWLTESFQQALDAFKQRDAVVLPGFVLDDDLPAVYSGADALVMASLAEGFGLPILEAMACGVPVACSSTTALGEIAGSAAAVFDPEDVDEMTDVIQRVLSIDDLRDSLRRWGLERASQFSWQKAAQQTWAIYQQVIAAYRA